MQKTENFIGCHAKNGIDKQIGSTLHDELNYGTTFLTSMTSIRTNDSITNVLSANDLTIKSDQLFDFWPLEHLETPFVSVDTEYNSAIDLMSAYSHAAKTGETFKVTGFSSGDKLFALFRSCLAVKVFHFLHTLNGFGHQIFDPPRICASLYR